MKVFQFRLEKVRQIRETQRRQSQARLLQTKRALNDQRRRLAYLFEREQQAESLYARAAQGVTSVTDIISSNAYVYASRKKTQAQQGEVTKAEDEVETAREELLERTKDKRVLDQLHDRRKAEYAVLAQREKQKQIDEVASQQRHTRIRSLTEKRSD